MTPLLKSICSSISGAGGMPYFVGGCVRDTLMDIEPKDFDVEVYNLSLDKLSEVLSLYGVVDYVGKCFGVLKIHGLNADFSLPRTEKKIGEGHKAFDVVPCESLNIKEATRRRDFTMNSLLMDIDGNIVDIFNGFKDIKNKILREVAAETFKEDSLRVLRAAQFISRFDLNYSDSLLKVCREINLNDLPGERIYEEFKKLFLKGTIPSKGIDFLSICNGLNIFPEIAALVDCPQDFEYHPEGTVFRHTLMSLDKIVELKFDNDEDNLVLFFSVLCHDFGKPLTTTFEDGRIKSHGHEEKGIEPTKNFLERLKCSPDFIDKICFLVEHHLLPIQLEEASNSSLRRWARRLGEKGLIFEMLESVSRCDYLGRTTDEALKGLFPAGDILLERVKNLQVENKPEPDVVMGRHLIELGFTPGPEFGIILNKCREIQYESGSKDKEYILESAGIK